MFSHVKLSEIDYSTCDYINNLFEHARIFNLSGYIFILSKDNCIIGQYSQISSVCKFNNALFSKYMFIASIDMDELLTEIFISFFNVKCLPHITNEYSLVEIFRDSLRVENTNIKEFVKFGVSSF